MDSTLAVESEIESMQKSGDFYAGFLFPEQEKSPTISDCLEDLKEIKVTTFYPLLLRLFNARQNSNLNDADLEKCLRLIESLLIRRAVCGVPTNALNKIFPQLAKNFPSTDHFRWLHRSLSAFSGSGRFPKDAEFATAFMTQPQYGRGTTRFILCRLEKSFNHKETVDLSTATIEHILPQTLSHEWEEELGPELEQTHTSLLHTLGNLTLTGYNSEMGNLPFSEKKNKLETTHIELNRWILQQTSWRALEIQARAHSLLTIANSIWTGPLNTSAD
jgi:hypothetical protein